MTNPFAIALLITGVAVMPVFAAEPMNDTMPGSEGVPVTSPAVNPRTLTASTLMSPGRYAVAIVPVFNSKMASRMEKAVAKVPGVADVSANAKESTLHFKVKDGSSVVLADIQAAVIKANAGAVMSTPILEDSMRAQTGI